MRTARVELMNALQADPANVAARLLKARVDLALGDGVAAEAEVDPRPSGGRGGRGHPPSARPCPAAAGRRARRAERSRRAGRRQCRLSRPHPRPRARGAGRRRAPARCSIGRWRSARRTATSSPMSPPSAAARAMSPARCRRSDRAVAVGPNNARALMLRGELTRGQYGLAAALPWFDRALEVDPGNVDARLERAITYGELGRMEDMLADAREAHRLSGGANNMAYYLQAVLAARARDYELARSIYNRTNGAFAERPSGMLLESAIDFGMGNAEQAAQRLTRLVAMQPGNRRARRLLAAARWRMDDPAGVIAALEPLVARPDADSYSLTLMGRALAAARRCGRRFGLSRPRRGAGAGALGARSARPAGVRRAAPAGGGGARQRAGAGAADLGLARARPGRGGARSRAPAAGRQSRRAGGPYAGRRRARHARRFRRRGRAVSPRRQSRFLRAGGAAADRGAAPLEPARCGGRRAHPLPAPEPAQRAGPDHDRGADDGARGMGRGDRRL